MKIKPIIIIIINIGHLIGELAVGKGYLKATVVRIMVTLGHLRVTIGYFFSISKHKANTTELHHKVRQTCQILGCLSTLKLYIKIFVI